jgi:cytochrome c-type biogenesis protein CcmH
VTRSRFIGLVVALAAALLASGASAMDGVREKEVFQRLFAPCCYRETLDVHVSPISEELRLEIRGRLERGETADAIVADMARRYGDEVLVRPPGRAVTLGLFGGAGALAAGLVGLAIWRARLAPREVARVTARPAPVRDEDVQLRDSLDDELAALD